MTRGPAADDVVWASLDLALWQLAVDEGLQGYEVRESKRGKVPLGLKRGYLTDAVQRASSTIVVVPVSGRKFQTPDFPHIGAVDVHVRSCAALIELLRRGPSEDLRVRLDAIKVALLGKHHSQHGYFVAGASLDAWERCEARDLFSAPAVSPRDLWTRKLDPRGPNSGCTVGCDLRLGNPYHSYPRKWYERLRLIHLPAVDFPGDYRVKATRVEVGGEAVDPPTDTRPLRLPR